MRLEQCYAREIFKEAKTMALKQNRENCTLDFIQLINEGGSQEVGDAGSNGIWSTEMYIVHCDRFLPFKTNLINVRQSNNQWLPLSLDRNHLHLYWTNFYSVPSQKPSPPLAINGKVKQSSILLEVYSYVILVGGGCERRFPGDIGSTHSHPLCLISRCWILSVTAHTDDLQKQPKSCTLSSSAVRYLLCESALEHLEKLLPCQ